MKLYSGNKYYKLYKGSMLDMLDEIEPNSVDAIVTDPPYELNFMNKGWDNSGIAFQKETWEKCLQVLKPGGHLLAFGGSRTYHRIAVAIEDAGFEIRDTIQWLYGSGMPKSLNIGLSIDKKNGVDNRTGRTVKGVGTNNTVAMKNGLGETQEFASVYEEREATNEWKGWGTCLKPAYEPIIVARKPCKGTITENVMAYRTGGMNIDECRVPLEDGFVMKETKRQSRASEDIVFNSGSCGMDNTKNTLASASPEGRFPANVILSYDKENADEVCEGFPQTVSSGGSGEASKANTFANTYNGGWGKEQDCAHLGGCGDKGSAARYFMNCPYEEDDWDLDDEELKELQSAVASDNTPYGLGEALRYCYTAKASKRDRNEGLKKTNPHPTVKPVSLMQYLVRLVTPAGGTVLDPFNGSGSTGKGTMKENLERGVGYKYIGIELTEEYLPVAKARIEYISKQLGKK